MRSKYVPLIFLGSISIFSITRFLFADNALSINHLLGYVSVLISVLLLFYNDRMYRNFFLIVLFLGIFSILLFSHITVVIGFTDYISLNLISIFTLFIFAYVERENIYNFQRNRNAVDYEAKKISLVEKRNLFKKRFANLSDKELRNRLQLDLQDEARRAIVEILNDRSEG